MHHYYPDRLPGADPALDQELESLGHDRDAERDQRAGTRSLVGCGEARTSPLWCDSCLTAPYVEGGAPREPFTAALQAPFTAPHSSNRSARGQDP